MEKVIERIIKETLYFCNRCLKRGYLSKPEIYWKGEYDGQVQLRPGGVNLFCEDCEKEILSVWKKS